MSSACVRHSGGIVDIKFSLRPSASLCVVCVEGQFNAGIRRGPQRKLLEFDITRAALVATARVQSAASCATDVHVTCKPTGDERTHAQDAEEDDGVQQKILQLSCVSSLNVSRLSAPALVITSLAASD